MWSAGSKVCDVYLGTRAFAVCEGGVLVLATDVEGLDGAMSGLAEWLNADAAPKRRRLRFWLSGGLCRPFIVPAVQGVANDAEVQTVAAAMAPQLTGLAGPCTVFVERRTAKAPVIATAIQEDRLGKIRDLVASSSRKPKLLSIKPWWAEVLRHGLAREPGLTALGVQDCDSMTVLIGREADGFDIATTYSPVTDQSTAQQVLTRALLSSDVTNNNELVGRLLVHRRREDGEIAGLALGSLVEFSR